MASLTCPHGHQWEASASDLTAGPLSCPICGVTVEVPASGSAVAVEPAPTEDTSPPDQASHHTPPPLMEAPTLPPSPVQAVALGLPTVAGYEILEELGRGGM